MCNDLQSREVPDGSCVFSLHSYQGYGSVSWVRESFDRYNQIHDWRKKGTQTAWCLFLEGSGNHNLTQLFVISSKLDATIVYNSALTWNFVAVVGMGHVAFLSQLFLFLRASHVLSIVKHACRNG